MEDGTYDDSMFSDFGGRTGVNGIQVMLGLHGNYHGDDIMNTSGYLRKIDSSNSPPSQQRHQHHNNNNHDIQQQEGQRTIKEMGLDGIYSPLSQDQGVTTSSTLLMGSAFKRKSNDSMSPGKLN